MNYLCRLTVSLGALLMVSGCSSIHGGLATDKPVSDLRAEVEAPVTVSASDSRLCLKPVEPEPELKLAVAPPPVTPFRARLYFILDTVTYIPESQAEAEGIYQEIFDRSPNEVIIVGHTDTAASDSYNEDLSMRRAQKVKQELIEFGIPEDVINISAQGEYNLLISTPDETVEVKNRRVEIDIR